MFLNKFTKVQTLKSKYLNFKQIINGKSKNNHRKNSPQFWHHFRRGKSCIQSHAFFLDMHYQGDTTTSLIGYIIFIIIVFWAIKDFKKNNNGYIRLSEALKTGVGTSLISALILCIYTIIMIEYLDPEFLDKSTEYQKQKLLQENPEISVENVDKMFDMQKEFSGPFIISDSLLFSIYFLVLSFH